MNTKRKGTRNERRSMARLEARDGRVIFEDRTRHGPDGKRVKYRVWGYTLGSESTREKVYREEWTEQDASEALRHAREARATGNLIRPADRTLAQVIEETSCSSAAGQATKPKRWSTTTRRC
jgi:hypothetical protein